MNEILKRIEKNNPNQPEFIQAVSEIFNSVAPVLARHPEWVDARIFERMFEPDRIIMFRVEWVDDAGFVQVNRGYRIQNNKDILGPYKGGLRYHPSVNLSILKFLAAEQTIKNALTGLPMGGAKGGADVDPKKMSESEIMRFSQTYMRELSKYIGSDIDVPAGDIGVGQREIGYMAGAYRQIKNDGAGFITGKGLEWGGSHIRTEACGRGLVYFAQEMLKVKDGSLRGKKCLVSGSGNVAQYAAEKLIEVGAEVLTMSDSDGYIYDPDGIDKEKLDWIMELKNVRRGRIEEYYEKFLSHDKPGFYESRPLMLKHNLIWNLRGADCAFPCATENELNGQDAKHLIKNGIKLVAEGANMPCTPGAIKTFHKAGVLFGPGKAANAGGVGRSGGEMRENSMRTQWDREYSDTWLRNVMKHIHTECLSAAEAYGQPGNYEAGANIAGFIKVAGAMHAQGVV